MNRIAFRALAAVVTAGLALTGCSGDDSGDAAPGVGDSGGGTRVVEHELGETEVPVQPEKVATLWAPTMSAMIALGEPPAGYAFNAEPIDGVDVPAGFDVGRMEHLGHAQELEFERIAAFAPDLIIATSVHEESYDKLSAIAPTVVLEWSGTGTWKEHLTKVAEVVGAEAAAADVRAEYDARVAEVAAAIGEPEAIETSIVRFHTEELRLEVRNSFAGQVVDDVGLARPPAQDVEEDTGYIPVSLERLPDGDGDAMFAFTIGADEGPDLLEQAQGNPLWQNLAAVRNDAVYPVDYKMWIAANYFGAHGILDDLEQALG